MNKTVWLWIIMYLALFMYYVPSFATFSDENEYIRGAYGISQGWMSVDDAHESYRYRFTGSKYVNLYPIGTSLLLFPFSLIGYEAMFLVGLICHLLSFFLIRGILRRVHLPQQYAILYLFHPGIVFFSRTVMSEAPSILMFAAAMFWYLGTPAEQRWAGAALGMAVLVRYTNIIGVAIIFGIAVWKEREKFWQMVIGITPFAMGIALYNFIVYEGIFNGGHSFSGQIGSFQRSDSLLWNTLELFGLNVGSLAMLYPGMILTPFLYQGKLYREIRWLTVGFVTFFSMAILGTFTFHYDWIRNIVIGPRYIFPIIPLMLIPYSAVMEQLCKRWKLSSRKVTILIGIVLIVFTAVISAQQMQYTNERSDISEIVYGNTPEGSLIVTGHLGISFLNEFLGDRDAIDFYYHTFPEVLAGREDVYAVYINQRPQDQYLTHDFELDDLKATVLDKVNFHMVYEQSSPRIVIWKLSRG